jgi:hypothetical protein
LRQARRGFSLRSAPQSFTKPRTYSSEARLQYWRPAGSSQSTANAPVCWQRCNGGSRGRQQFGVGRRQQRSWRKLVDRWRRHDAGRWPLPAGPRLPPRLPAHRVQAEQRRRASPLFGLSNRIFARASRQRRNQVKRFIFLNYLLAPPDQRHSWFGRMTARRGNARRQRVTLTSRAHPFLGLEWLIAISMTYKNGVIRIGDSPK